jgi:hypothetical protein
MLAKDLRAALRPLDFGTIKFHRGSFHYGLAAFACQALPAVGDGVGRDTVKPCGEGDAAPLECRNIGQSLMEDFRGNVLDIRARVDTPRNKRVHALEVLLVKIDEARRVLLRRLDEKPLVGFLRLGPQKSLRKTRSL